MKLNKSVYLPGGAIGLCEYDTDDLTDPALWMCVFAVAALLNAFAVVGNLLNVVACFLQKEKTPLIIYIHALAVSDLLYAVIAPLYTYRFYLRYWKSLIINFTVVANLSRSLSAVGFAFSFISCWLVVALSVDRLILTRFPFRAPVWSTTKRSYITISFIVFFSLCFASVSFYEYFEVPVTIDECSGYWRLPTEITREDNSTYVPIRYRSEYRRWSIVIMSFCFYISPMFTLLVVNAMTVASLKRTNSVQPSDGGQSRRADKKKAVERRLTKMAVVVSLTFVLCNLPDIISRFLWSRVSMKIASEMQAIAHVFLMINISSNFVVYFLFNKKLFHTLAAWVKCAE